jgi:soluble lytic murein transglycosylase-like protein
MFVAFSIALLSPAANAGNQQQYAQLIASTARANGVPVEVAMAVVRHESNFNPRVTGRAGEIGLMQIKLATARGIGYRGTRQGLYDPRINLTWGMKYLGTARKLAGGSECGMLSRYNGGLGTTRSIKGYCHSVAQRKIELKNGPKDVRVARNAAKPSKRKPAGDTGFFGSLFAAN